MPIQQTQRFEQQPNNLDEQQAGPWAHTGNDMSRKQKQEWSELEKRYSFNLREAARMKAVGEVGLATELVLEADELKERLDQLIAA